MAGGNYANFFGEKSPVLTGLFVFSTGAGGLTRIVDGTGMTFMRIVQAAGICVLCKILKGVRLFRDECKRNWVSI